jgi:hypothetical protein
MPPELAHLKNLALLLLARLRVSDERGVTALELVITTALLAAAALAAGAIIAAKVTEKAESIRLLS